MKPSARPPSTHKETGHTPQKGGKKEKGQGKKGEQERAVHGEARWQTLFPASHQVRRVSFDDLSTPLILFSGSL